MTAVALHIQAERGQLDYHEPVVLYWPEFGKHGEHKGEVFDTLTRRIGVLPAGVSRELMCDWNWMLEKVADMHPLFEPGTKSGYMTYTLGYMNSAVSGPHNTSHKS